MRNIAYGLVGMVVLLLQAVVLPRYFPYYAMPDLFLCFVVVLTLLKGRSVGLIVAFLSGILQDVVISNLFAFHIISYVTIAYICSRWSYSIYEEQWYKTAVGVAISTIVVAIIQGFILWIGKEPVQIWSYVFYHGLGAMFFNALLGAAIHWALRSSSDEEPFIW